MILHEIHLVTKDFWAYRTQKAVQVNTKFVEMMVNADVDRDLSEVYRNGVA